MFADDVVESSEVTSGITRIGDYELHDLVLLEYTFSLALSPVLEMIFFFFFYS